MTAFARAVEDIEAAQHLKNLDVYGYTVVEQFLVEDAVDDLLGRVVRLWDGLRGRPIAGRPARDADDLLVYNLQAKDKTFIDLLVDPFVTHVCAAMLNDPYYRFLPPELPNYILSYYNARSSGQALDLHIDSHLPSPGHRTWAMQCVFLLQDARDDNGCSVVVPGSHRSGAFTDRDLARVEPLPGQAGDLVMWDSRLWHGTSANSSDRTRWSLVATFTQWWVKQTMDIPRGLPEEVYAELSDQQKALLGFCAIPPATEDEGINTKAGYAALRPRVADYWR